MKARTRILLAIGIFCVLFGITQASPERYFPDIGQYHTLICDFHMHTVFSDGQVWPTVRVNEAAREHLDAIAITDHIEYQPHKNDIPTNHNRPYEIATKSAKKKDVLLIKGAEITRDTPPGHYNAIFMIDIDPLDIGKFLDVIKNANEQKGFVFWNHHAWKGQERGRWMELQTTMLKNKWLHGMEVANGSAYYPKAHQWCLEKKLTMLGNSDIHAPSNLFPYTAERHRTVTLVFAKERSIETIREALFARRTAVWHKNQLIGQKEHLQPLFDACVTFSQPQEAGDGAIFVEIKNTALIDLALQREGRVGPLQIVVPARSAVSIPVQTNSVQEGSVLLYRVRNFLIAPEQGLLVKIPLGEPAGALVAD